MPATPTVNPTRAALEAAVLDLTDEQIASALCKVDRVVKLPCRRVTSCIFGGVDLGVLYITTVRYGLSEADLAEQPLAGGIFALDAGVKGVPDGEFAG